MERDGLRIHWPIPLWELCESRGPDLVYSVGMELLKYPPTWCELPMEFDAVNNAMKGHDHGTTYGFQWDR